MLRQGLVKDFPRYEGPCAIRLDAAVETVAEVDDQLLVGLRSKRVGV